MKRVPLPARIAVSKAKILAGEGHPFGGSVEAVRPVRKRVRIGAPDPSLTGCSGLAVLTEFADQLEFAPTFGPAHRADQEAAPGVDRR